MTSTARFIVLWAAVTVPPMALGDWVGPYLVNTLMPRLFIRGGVLEVWLVFAASALGFTAIAAFGQSRLLARSGRHARHWVLATVVAQAVAISVSYSIWTRGGVQAAAGTRTPVFWILMAGGSASYGLTMGVARGLSFWGRRWPPVWPFWLTGSIAIFMAMWVFSLAYNLAAGEPAPDTWSARALQLAYHVGEAAATAWLIRRVASADKLIGSTNPHSP